MPVLSFTVIINKQQASLSVVHRLCNAFFDRDVICNLQNWITVSLPTWQPVAPMRQVSNPFDLRVYSVESVGMQLSVFHSDSPLPHVIKKERTCIVVCCPTRQASSQLDVGVWPLEQCFSTAGPRPDTGPWHQLYRAARICHFRFQGIFHE
jgi:hypothetical protein